MVEKSTNVLNSNELAILACFLPNSDNRTTKEIEMLSGFSHERAYTFLMGLAKKNYLKSRQVGRAYMFSLNEDANLLLPFFNFQFERKEKFFSGKQKAAKPALEEFLKKIENDSLVSLILFGNYVRGKKTEKETLDLLCIMNEKYKVDNIAVSIEYSFGRRLKPIVMTPEEFRKTKSDKPDFYIDVIDSGIVMYGIESFYRFWKIRL